MRRDRAPKAFTILTVLAVACAACSDLRDYTGEWTGARVGDAPALAVGVAPDATARLAIATVDPHGLHATLSIDHMIETADLTSLAGAEADALAGTTFTGSPLRVYFSFVDIDDGMGQALALVALFPGPRVEVRILRGGAAPIYAIFALVQDP